MRSFDDPSLSVPANGRQHPLIPASRCSFPPFLSRTSISARRKVPPGINPARTVYVHAFMHSACAFLPSVRQVAPADASLCRAGVHIHVCACVRATHTSRLHINLHICDAPRIPVTTYMCVDICIIYMYTYIFYMCTYV